MAASTGTNGNGSAKDVQDAYAALKGDIAELTSALKALTAEQTAEVKKRAEETAVSARKAGIDAAQAGQDMFEEQLARGQVAVRNNPGTSVAIAAGLGFLVGLTMANRR